MNDLNEQIDAHFRYQNLLAATNAASIEQHGTRLVPLNMDIPLGEDWLGTMPAPLPGILDVLIEPDELIDHAIRLGLDTSTF